MLFTEAPGQVLAYVAEDAFRYGAAAARLHDAMDAFHTELPRFRLDLDHLLDEPLGLIRPFAERLGS